MILALTTVAMAVIVAILVYFMQPGEEPPPSPGIIIPYPHSLILRPAASKLLHIPPSRPARPPPLKASPLIVLTNNSLLRLDAITTITEHLNTPSRDRNYNAWMSVEDFMTKALFTLDAEEFEVENWDFEANALSWDLGEQGSNVLNDFHL